MFKQYECKTVVVAFRTVEEPVDAGIVRPADRLRAQIEASKAT
jgi:hypothetical protein